MGKHTPGPWRADVRIGCVAVYPGERVNCIAESEDRRLYYAQGFKVKNESGFMHWDIEPEKVANAHLIAAAPELYEALKELLPSEEEGSGWWCPTCERAVPGTEVTYEEYHETCGTYMGVVNDSQWLRKARYTIAKAEGKFDG